ncbi:LuxR family transcriptional regulator [Mycobacterium sp. URHB0044]|uniref:helix-turn-helix transcriptional regulator n=1 Tax=Mycobacterium sp. URHB0044 TaxID=1380386 RepID=UPI001E4FC72E|nr:LuxR family transcriptional regulator [Mycobacterium sp. URHB0044]
MWPLTGRSGELRRIDAAVVDPDSSGIIVCGAAGVGKSRLAREALNAAASTGCAVRWIVGTSSARILPLGALAQWAEPAVSDNLDLVRGVIAALTATPPGETVVLGVDDVPLLDDLSTFVVHQIIQRRAAKVVFTIRDGEPVPAGTRELWRAGQFDRLDLQPLAQAEIGPLVSSTLSGPIDPQAVERLWTLTRGNPLYLRNIVEQEVADQRLTPSEGYWRWLGDPVVPPSLVDLIEERIGALPTPVSDVIDALAVGEPIELGSLTRITDPTTVEQADTRGLITLNQVGNRIEARLGHPLYGEVRRSRAAPTRLRRLRGLVAAELAGSDDRDDTRVVIRRAALTLDSDREPDTDLFIQAARGAVWLWDMPLADRLAEAAIAGGGAAEASFVRAFGLSCVGRGLEADAVLADITTRELTDVERARLAFLRATNRMFVLADPEGAKELIDDAARTATPGAQGCVDAFLAVYWAAMGMPEAARTSCENFSWDQLPDLVAKRHAAWAIAVASGSSGRTTEAAATAEAGYSVPIRSFLILTDAQASAQLLAGRIAEAQRPARHVRDHSALPADAYSRLATALTGRVALGAGQLDTACALLQSVADRWLIAPGETTGWKYRCQILLTIALAMRGLVEEASDALATLAESRHPAWRFLDYEYAIAKAWVAAAQGAVSEAIKIVLGAAETCSENGQFAAEVTCLQTATQFGDGSSAPRLRQLEAIVEGPRARIAARFAEALHANDGDELAAVSEQFEAMGDLVAAVDAAAHAAIAYRGHDRRGSALGCATRAQALAEQCGGAATPALRQAAEPLPLTNREREIVTLLGEGLSNRDIAARLILSVRTVEDHIYKAMTKTGTTSRDELAALIPRRQNRRRNNSSDQLN